MHKLCHWLLYFLNHKLDFSLWDHKAWGHRSSHCLFSPHWEGWQHLDENGFGNIKSIVDISSTYSQKHRMGFSSIMLQEEKSFCKMKKHTSFATSISSVIFRRYDQWMKLYGCSRLQTLYSPQPGKPLFMLHEGHTWVICVLYVIYFYRVDIWNEKWIFNRFSCFGSRQILYHMSIC